MLPVTGMFSSAVPAIFTIYSKTYYKVLLGKGFERRAQLSLIGRKTMSSEKDGLRKEKDDRRNMSRHILPTSGNLLGLCFAILSFIKLSDTANATIIDEVMLLSIILFLLSSIVSYASIRSLKKEEHYERIAEFIFLGGLFLMGICAVVVVTELIR